MNTKSILESSRLYSVIFSKIEFQTHQYEPMAYAIPTEDEKITQLLAIAEWDGLSAVSSIIDEEIQFAQDNDYCLYLHLLQEKEHRIAEIIAERMPAPLSDAVLAEPTMESKMIINIINILVNKKIGWFERIRVDNQPLDYTKLRCLCERIQSGGNNVGSILHYLVMLVSTGVIHHTDLHPLLHAEWIHSEGKRYNLLNFIRTAPQSRDLVNNYEFASLGDFGLYMETKFTLLGKYVEETHRGRINCINDVNTMKLLLTNGFKEPLLDIAMHHYMCGEGHQFLEYIGKFKPTAYTSYLTEYILKVLDRPHYLRESHRQLAVELTEKYSCAS